MIYGGLDIGTTGSKLTVFDDYAQKERFYLNYPSKRDNNGHEIDANIIYSTVIQLLEIAVQKYQITSIGITSFGETFVLLDKFDNILFPSLLYTDPRGNKEALYLERKIGKKKLGEITGQVGQGMFSLPKLMYIKKHYKSIYKNVDKVLLIEDFIVYKLTGIRQIDYSLASRTLAFDVNKREWSKEILDAAGIDENLFSKPVPIGSIAGNIKQSLKNELGLKNDIKIINISHDQIANAIGGGVLSYGTAIDGCGTCECLTMTYQNIPNDKDIYECGYGVIPYIKDNYNVSYALINTGGALVEWIINTYFFDLKGKEKCFDILNNNILNHPTNVMILPHFAGASTPYMDPFALGTITNLNLGTNRYEIYQACLESLSYEMLISINKLKKMGININEIYASGGGAKNDAWLQIKANIFNIPIHQLENNDTGTIGSAIVVGHAIGLFSSYEDGVNKLTKVKKTFYPDVFKHQEYMKIFKKYQLMYERMKKVRI